MLSSVYTPSGLTALRDWLTSLTPNEARKLQNM